MRDHKNLFIFLHDSMSDDLKGIDTKILEILTDVNGGGEQIRERKKPNRQYLALFSVTYYLSHYSVFTNSYCERIHM